MADARRIFEAPDARKWGVEIRAPGYSSMLIVFVHPDPRTARLNRYVSYNWHGPEAENVTARVDARKALDGISDAELRALFLRSIPINPVGNPLGLPAQITR